MHRDPDPPGDAVSAGGLAPLALAFAVAALPSAALPDGMNPRILVDVEGLVGNVADAPHRSVGGRVTAGLQGRSLLSFVLAEYQGHPSTARVEPRFDGLFVLGAGIGHAPRPWGAGRAALLLGYYDVEVRDHLRGGWVRAGNSALGARVGAMLTPARLGSRFTISPALGVSFTALWVPRTTDPVRRVSWGGFTPMFTFSLGAEALSPGIATSWL